MSDWARTGRWRRPWRVFFVFLLTSIAAHAVVLGVLPALTRDSGSESASVLQVTILDPTPLPVASPESVPPPRPRAAVEAKPRAERPAPVLALSEPRVAEGSSFAVLTDKPESPRPAPEPKPEVASAAATPTTFNAAYLSNPAPRYPDAARRAGEQGTVTLRVLVTREGLPARVGVEKSSGSTYLDNAALEAVKAWRFAPARQGAERIESWMLVPVVFRLEGAS